MGGFRAKPVARSAIPTTFQSLIGFWVVFGQIALKQKTHFQGFQSLIGFWVVFGSSSSYGSKAGFQVSIPNRVLGGFRAQSQSPQALEFDVSIPNRVLGGFRGSFVRSALPPASVSIPNRVLGGFRVLGEAVPQDKERFNP